MVVIEQTDTQESEPLDSHYSINESGTVTHYDGTTHFALIVPKKYEEVFRKLMSVMDYKGSHYNTEPLDYVEPVTILHQIKLKIERSLQVKNGDKQLDDILDTAVYSIRLLHRVMFIRKAHADLQSKLNTNRVEE